MPAPLTYDGFSTAIRGMNNGLDGSLLPPDQYQLGINTTCRGGFIAQRPGFKRIMICLEPGFFQHGGWLRNRDGKIFLVAVKDGRFYSIDPIEKLTQEFTIPGDHNPATLPVGWSIPGGAEGFWIYNDGQTLPLIWNGASARRATAKEIKPGRVIAYVQGRLWYARPDGVSFRAADLVGNTDSGTPAYDYKDSILSETENTYLNEGGDFAVPADSGGITAMAATAVLDTAQGQGPLQVICKRIAFSVNTPVDRTIWKSVQYPIQTESQISAGADGAQSTIHVNGDLFMRADDGIRSFIIARRLFRDWGNTPQSYEVSNIINKDQEDLLLWGSAVVTDNRMLMTVSPGWSQGGVFHRGLVAMDLSPISSIQNNGTPCYDGIWTGVNILTVLKTDIGTYAFVLAANGNIELWQITKDEVYDNDGTGRVQWTVVPRRMFVDRDQAGRPLWNLKKLQTGDLFYDSLQGTVDFKISWKPDVYPCWQLWNQWEECAPTCQSTPGCTPSGSFQTQYQPRHRLPEPPDVCVAGIKRPLRDFYEADFRLDVVGPARFRGVRLGAVPQTEASYDADCDAPTCVAIQCCEFDPFTYVAAGTSGNPPYTGTGMTGNPPTPYEYPYPTPPGVPITPPSGGGSTAPPENTGVTPPQNPPGTPPGSPPGTPTQVPGPFLPVGDNPFPVGAQIWQPFFDDDVGNSRPMGYGPYNAEPPAQLDPATLQTWADAVRVKWEAYKAENSILPNWESLYWQFSPGDAQLRFNPGLYFGPPPSQFQTAAWKWEIWVVWTQ